ncbi:MAG: EAL domain-containing protein [Alphaproteobacteria bacterium]|nr:EAL domain-containing protein [Alphaproteobacteria bacterium]
MAILKYFSRVLPARRPIGVRDLEHALAKNEFVFYYQPEWDLKTGQILGLEALVRWNSPTRGLVAPMEFIPLMERSGLINKFTPLLLEQTLRDLNLIHRAGFGTLTMSINISVVQLKDISFVSIIQKYLNKYKIAPQFLECELTESVEMHGHPLEERSLQALQALRIPISIDDFGTAYSSFGHLKRVDAYKLKIDRDFVINLFNDIKNEKIVRMIIQLGHSLGLMVLAEGIETPEQEQWLLANGCDAGQGFWFSRPLPLDLLLPFLKKHTGAAPARTPAKKPAAAKARKKPAAPKKRAPRKK